MKEKSEEHILNRLVDEVNDLNKIINRLHELEYQKTNLNRKIADGIKKEGVKFDGKLDKLKDKTSKIISQQNDLIFVMRKTITKIRHLINLLIDLEKASLVIHNDLKKDELSEIIDYENMPLNQFKVELEHVDTLKANLEVLLVELAKQEKQIQNFSLKSINIDESNFYQSQRYITMITSSGIGSVWELKNFCTNMEAMIKKKLKRKQSSLTESDRVAHDLIHELKKIKIKRGIFFSFTMYDFTKQFVYENLNTNNSRKLVLFLISFLLSRLKKFDPDSYYSQIRATILTYNLLKRNNQSNKRKNVLTGACLLKRIESLNLPKIENATEFKNELGVVRKYYNTVKVYFDSEFPFLNKILDVLQKKKGEYESQLNWVEEGARTIKIVYEFDKKLVNHSFDKEEIKKNKDGIYTAIEKKHKKHADDIEFLIKNWNSLIPKKLRR